MMQVVCLTLLLLALLCGCCIEGRPAISTRCNGKLKVAVSGSQRRRSVSSNEDALQITAAATTTAMPAARAASAGPSLMKINVLMLFFYMTLGATLPFLPLFYRRLGINDSGVGLLGAITPAITFLVSPSGARSPTPRSNTMRSCSLHSLVALQCVWALQSSERFRPKAQMTSRVPKWCGYWPLSLFPQS